MSVIRNRGRHSALEHGGPGQARQGYWEDVDGLGRMKQRDAGVCVGGSSGTVTSLQPPLQSSKLSMKHSAETFTRRVADWGV
jgi:hypothetical protein